MTFKRLKEMLVAIEEQHPNIEDYEIIFEKWDEYTWNRYIEVGVNELNKEIIIMVD